MQKIFFILLLAAAGQPLQATIRILTVVPAAADSCQGSITVEATGSAGPFRIQLLTPGGGLLLEKNMTTPAEAFSGLCAGVYTVLVYNRLGCARTLTADLSPQQPAITGAAPPAAALPAGNGFALRAQPNPFSADFQLQVLWERPQSETLTIEIFNALGQLLFTRRLEAVTGINPVPVHLPASNSGGLLHVTARDAAGSKAVLRVVQVRE